MRGGGAGPEYQCRAAATSPLNITATGGDNALAGAGAGVEAMVMLTPHQAGHRARSPEAHHNRDHNQVSGGRVVTAPVAPVATSAPAAGVGTDQAGRGQPRPSPVTRRGNQMEAGWCVGGWRAEARLVRGEAATVGHGTPPLALAASRTAAAAWPWRISLTMTWRGSSSSVTRRRTSRWSPPAA